MSDEIPLLAALRRYDPQLTEGAVDPSLDVTAEPAATAWLATWADDQRQLVELLLQERRQRASGVEDLERAVGLLSRAARDMASNAASALEAGLEGDARRWRVVRADVLRALQLLGAVPPDE